MCRPKANSYLGDGACMGYEAFMNIGGGSLPKVFVYDKDQGFIISEVLLFCGHELEGPEY